MRMNITLYERFIGFCSYCTLVHTMVVPHVHTIIRGKGKRAVFLHTAETPRNKGPSGEKRLKYPLVLTFLPYPCG